ncbi:hypothetical protein Salat_0723700 [Sesamum alatum]|uniref:Uncharacterized protein n=1 Tax=Sesamum alatum TaxID=300844 RepID=A0AAE2CV28_9LAMI|nr:hypothetical protein Salat_0723700 [Sesamum alatum]
MVLEGNAVAILSIRSAKRLFCRPDLDRDAENCCISSFGYILATNGLDDGRVIPPRTSLCCIVSTKNADMQLETQVHRMKTELEYTFWDRKELKERLQTAIRERKMMEVMLMELEGEHDEAIVKIELLLEEVQDLKDEIRRLKEVQGKASWDNRGQADTGNASSIKNSDHFRTSLCSSGHHDKETEDAMHDLLKSGSEPQEPTRPNTTDINLNNLVKHDILSKQREVALSRSLFSAVLSLIVGIIVWEAEDPCIPLVVALFTVVSMSLMSVVRFFSTIKHKPASDAVALLSFNWFILGTLAYPTLPGVARLLAPFVSNLLERTFKGWLISSSSM